VTTEQPALRRSLSLPLITLYGVGTTVGAGIYALMGEVAGLAGMQAPVAFLVASLLAAFTAFSFAELSSRYPRSAGEAVYVHEGLGWPRLGAFVGLLVASAGSVSAATISTAFVGYLAEVVIVPRALALLALVIALGGIAFWGIRESVMLASLVTLIEVGGLLLVVWVARGSLGSFPERAGELLPSLDVGAWGGTLAAALLAFYAFLGFEDMVNVAEEVRDVRRNLPLAIVITLAVTTALYVLLASVAVLSVPPAELRGSDAPLAEIYARATGQSPLLLAWIGIVAMVNGALVQIIMASRVLYGLARQGSLPAWLGRVEYRTRTPAAAIAVTSCVVLALALWIPLVRLAEITSVMTLVVFALVNLALWRVKRAGDGPSGVGVGVRTVPAWVPVAGFVATASMLGFEAVRYLG
jgi:amino acid transporter